MSHWPRVILHFLFSFPPTSFSVGVLAFFLYGNGLSRSMALHLVRVCHDSATDAMLDQVDNLLTTWAASSDIRLASYETYDFRHSCGSTVLMVRAMIF